MKNKGSIFCIVTLILICLLGLSSFTLGAANSTTKCKSHSWGQWYTTKKATCTNAGQKRRTCLKCGAKGYQTIKALGHTGGTATCVKKKVCTRCGKEYGSLNSSNHTGGTTTKTDARVVVGAKDLCYTVKVHTLCKSCGKELSSTTNRATSHSVGSDGKCTICGFQVVTKPAETAANHTVVKSGWRSDATNHWKVCTYPNCTQHKGKEYDKGVHIWSSWTLASSGREERHCTVQGCGRTEYRDKTPVEPTETAANHVVVKSSWRSDATNHWKVCTYPNCTQHKGKEYDKGVHIWSSWTLASSGREERHCTVQGCGRTEYRDAAKTETETVANHTVVKSGWYHDSTYHWKICSYKGCTQHKGKQYDKDKHTYSLKNGTECMCGALRTAVPHASSHTLKYSEVSGMGTHRISCTFPNCSYKTTSTSHVISSSSKYEQNPTGTKHRLITTKKCTKCTYSETTYGDWESHVYLLSTDTKCARCGATRTSTPSGGNGSSGGSSGGGTVTLPGGSGEFVAAIDVIGTYDGTELAKPTENATLVPTGANINVNGTSNSPTITISSIKATWDDLTDGESISGANGSIKVPNTFEPNSEHTLHLIATASDNSTASKDYIIKIPGKIEVNVEYNGNVINPNEEVEAKNGDPMKLLGTPTELVVSISYVWDDGKIETVDGADIDITVPDNLKPGLHKLMVQGSSSDGSVSELKTYIIRIVGDSAEDSPLQVLPWENENHEMTQLGILLRNDSLSSKANKNIYALEEDVTYYLDYKNGGVSITEPVTLTLNVPLEFEIVEANGGEVDGNTVIWKYESGMEAGQAGTRTVVLRYKSLSKSDIVAEKIYPLATISTNGRVEDSSAVINIIYKDSATVITNVYNNKTKQIEAIHGPYMYGDANATTFRPDSTITRAEGALVLVRILFGQDTINSATVTNRFPDLNETYLEAQKAISVATNYGLIKGYEDGTCKPNKTMTRAEFMKILATFLAKDSVEKGIEGLGLKDMSRAVKVYNNPVSQYLVDGQVVTKHWAINEVSLLMRLNMTSLSENELDLRMDKGITRAEVAQLVNFYLLRAPAETEGIVSTGFSDVSMSHKLVSNIIEATRATHNFVLLSDGKEYGM